MKIGIDLRLLTTPHKTGVGVFAANLVQALLGRDKANHYVLFANRANGSAPEEFNGWRRDNVSLVVTGYPNTLVSASAAIFGRPKLDKYMGKKAGRLDVFFSPNFNFTPLSAKVKFLLMVHDLSFEFFPDYFSPRQRAWHAMVRPRQQCERADIIVVPSVHTKGDIVERYRVSESKVHVLSPGPSIGAPSSEDIQKKYHLPEKYILFIGAIERRKNVDGLMEAFLWWKKTHEARPYSLVLAGPIGAYGKAVLERVRSLSDVVWIGYVPDADKVGLYAGASLFVYPSFYEGFGFPVLDAMTLGVPVVTSNRTSLPELTDGAAYLVNPYNVAEIGFGIHRLLSDPSLAAWYRDRGLEQAKKFRWENAAEQFLQLCV